MNKRYFLIFILVFTLFFDTFVYAASGTTIVHVTRTGEKYHKSGCSYLKSDISITLQDAVDSGYTPCSRCSPPRLDAADINNTSVVATSNETYSTPVEKNNYDIYYVSVGISGVLFGIYNLYKRKKYEAQIRKMVREYELQHAKERIFEDYRNQNNT